MSEAALPIAHIARTYRNLGLNLSAVEALAAFCVNHPRKNDVLLKKLQRFDLVDPYLFRFKEGKAIATVFKKMSIYSMFLVNSDKDKYVFMGKYLNDTMLNVEISKYNREYYPLDYINIKVAVVFALKKIQEDLKKERKEHQRIIDLDTTSDVKETGSNVDTSLISDHFSAARQTSFSDLPSDLRDLVLKTIPREELKRDVSNPEPNLEPSSNPV